MPRDRFKSSHRASEVRAGTHTHQRCKDRQNKSTSAEIGTAVTSGIVYWKGARQHDQGPGNVLDFILNCDYVGKYS